MNNPPVLEVEAGPPMPLGARLLNIFAAPGEVFEAIKTTPTATRDWLMPMFLSCLMGIIHVNVIFSQPAVIQVIKEQQAQSIQEMVAAGKIPADKADAVEEQMQRFGGPAVMKTISSFGAVASVFAITFLIGLGTWLVG
jgi:hypothetical protein